MFEIHGFFTSKDIPVIDRLSKNLTLFYLDSSYQRTSDKLYKGLILNLTTDFNNKENVVKLKNCQNHKTVILPPIRKAVEAYNNYCDRIIINFNCLENYKPPIHPNQTMTELEMVLNSLDFCKEKCLIQLSGNCYDYSMSNHSKITLTNNQAVLKALVHSSQIIFDEKSGNSYFTYLGENLSPRFVWVEDTKSLSVKHNLIKEKGYLGICWENVHTVSEGNWESMYMAYKKIHT